MEDINYIEQKDSLFVQRISNKKQLEGLEESLGILLETSEGEARRIIASLKDKKYSGRILLRSADDSFNRRAIETLKIDYLVFSNMKDLKDTLKQRDSGINHVVAREAKKKDIIFVIDISVLEGLRGKEKSAFLSKMIQNVIICRKNNVSLKIASFGKKAGEVVSSKGRSSFGFSIGMDSRACAESVQFG